MIQRKFFLAYVDFPNRLIAFLFTRENCTIFNLETTKENSKRTKNSSVHM